MEILLILAGIVLGVLIGWIIAQPKLQSLKSSFVKKETEYEILQKKHKEDKVELQNIEKQFTDAFKNLATQILEDKSRKFTELNRNNIEEILKPLKEKIKDFQDKIEYTNTENIKRNTSLIEKIGYLEKLGLQMSDEALKLTKALKGETKTQGNWGEMILEKILENSGLTEGEEYISQTRGVKLIGENGNLQKPDIIINLPRNKNIIIDSKVSLVSYELWVNAKTENERNNHTKELVISVKNHINELSKKHYQNLEGINSPDFVLLFMPIEASFSVAARSDNTLFQYAWDKKIVIVTPTTLMATLYTIKSLWRQEDQTKNALDIAKKSGALYDKFVNFIESLQKIGEHIDKSKEMYEKAFNQLKDGKGNLIRQAENIKKMGAITKKSLPKDILDDE